MYISNQVFARFCSVYFVLFDAEGLPRLLHKLSVSLTSLSFRLTTSASQLPTDPHTPRDILPLYLIFVCGTEQTLWPLQQCVRRNTAYSPLKQHWRATTSHYLVTPKRLSQCYICSNTSTTYIRCPSPKGRRTARRQAFRP